MRAVPAVVSPAPLVLRAQRGDARAFAELVRAFLRAAYSVALAVVGRRADAEDVVQDAFAAALERIRDCREPERFAGWLLTIVRNRAHNWLDARKLRDVAARPDLPGGSIEPAERGDEARLCRALAGLAATQREVVLLHDLEEWTHSEIAAALGMSEVMSRQTLFQARKLLRAQLAPEAAKVTS
jgi:RNA polymerase sigma-70 factor (ECF subfamily)